EPEVVAHDVAQHLAYPPGCAGGGQIELVRRDVRKDLLGTRVGLRKQFGTHVVPPLNALDPHSPSAGRADHSVDAARLRAGPHTAKRPSSRPGAAAIGTPAGFNGAAVPTEVP